MSDRIAHEYLQATNGDMRAALLRMASTIETARMRTDDIASGHRGMAESFQLIARDLRPNDRRALLAQERTDGR